jgi:hypothetical protein
LFRVRVHRVLSEVWGFNSLVCLDGTGCIVMNSGFISLLQGLVQ